MKKRDWLFLFAIVLSAILFRFLFMAKNYAIGFDQVNYFKLAASGKLFGLNHVLHTYWSPLYPLVIALLSYLIPDVELAGKLTSILCASFLIIPLFFFVKANFNKKVAYGSSLLIAFYSFSANLSGKGEPEFLYSILAIGGIILGWYAIKNQEIGKAFVVGLLFGFAYLAKPEGIGFLMMFLGITFFIAIIKIITKAQSRSYFFIILLSGLGFGIVSFPYILYLHREAGIWTISTKGISNQQGEMYEMTKKQNQENPFHVLSDDNKRLLQDEIYHIGNFLANTRAKGQYVVKISALSLAKKTYENFYKLLTEEFTKVLPLPLVMLLALGLFTSPWVKEKALINLYLLSYVFFYWIVLIPLFHITLRYFVPLLPISFIWIAQGADNFIEWFTTTIRNLFKKLPAFIPVKSIGLLFIVTIISFTSILPEFGKHIRKNVNSTDEWAPAVEQKKAGLWLKENGVKNPIIMAYNHAVSFYAGNYNVKESVEIPENKIDRILVYAKYRHVNYLVLNDRYKHKCPLISHLYEQKEVPPELTLIYTDQAKNGFKTLIYELKICDF